MLLAVALGSTPGLLGCSPRPQVPPSPITTPTTETAVLEPTETAHLAGPSTDLPAGHAYLVLSTLEPPYLHRLARVPSFCLERMVKCPAPEMSTSYPQEGITTSHLHWTTDSKGALLLDTYEPRILIFEPADDGLQTLANDVPTIHDDLAWLSDGRAAFVVQNSDETSRLVSLDWQHGESQPQTLAEFDGIAYLLGNDEQGRLILSLEIYGFPGNGDALKKVVTDVQLLALDPVTGASTELWPDNDWLTERPQQVLPDGQWLVYGSDETSLWNLQSGEKIPIGDNASWPTASPDRRWLAMVFGGSQHYEVRVLELATGNWRKLAELPAGPKLYWTPDSQYVVLAGSDEASAAFESLQIVSPEGGPVLIPQIDLGDYPVVEDLSWGP